MCGSDRSSNVDVDVDAYKLSGSLVLERDGEVEDNARHENVGNEPLHLVGQGAGGNRAREVVLEERADVHLVVDDRNAINRRNQTQGECCDFRRQVAVEPYVQLVSAIDVHWPPRVPQVREDDVVRGAVGDDGDTGKGNRSDERDEGDDLEHVAVWT